MPDPGSVVAVQFDVMCMAVPEHVDPTVLLIDGVPSEQLRSVAIQSLMPQYEGQPPRAILLDSMDALVTNERADIEKFQPAHDCAACRAGNDQADTFLRDHPGRWLVLANVAYREIW